MIIVWNEQTYYKYYLLTEVMKTNKILNKAKVVYITWS